MATRIIYQFPPYLLVIFFQALRPALPGRGPPGQRAVLTVHVLGDLLPPALITNVLRAHHRARVAGVHPPHAAVGHRAGRSDGVAREAGLVVPDSEMRRA